MWESLPQESFAGQERSNISTASAGSGEIGQEEKKQAEQQPPRQEEAVKPVQYIENPMPLPKKHVKKVMDYPFTPNASQMHFDIEVDPNDNFDF